MNKNRNCAFNYIIIIFLLALGFVFCITSCTAFKKPSIDNDKEKKDSKEIPAELNDLKKAIEEIEKTLHSLQKKDKESNISENGESKGEESQEENKDQSSDNKDEENNKSSKEESKNAEKKEQLQIQLKPEELTEYNKQQKLIEEQDEVERREKEALEKFETLKKDIAELHSLWNNVEPNLISALASQNSINAFEDALNTLTISIEIPDVHRNLLSLIELNKVLPDFYELYDTKENPDLDRLRYAIKKIILVSEKEDYEKIESVFDYLNSQWSKVKPKLKEDSLSYINKFDFALSDLKTAIDKKNKIIINTKSIVIIKILDELEESLENSKNQ